METTDTSSIIQGSNSTLTSTTMRNTPEAGFETRIDESADAVATHNNNDESLYGFESYGDNLPQQERNDETNENLDNEENRRHASSSPPSSTLMKVLLAVIRKIFIVWLRFLCIPFTCFMPRKLLHVISIFLLCIHLIVQKMLDTIPHLWIEIFSIIGRENIPQELQNAIFSGKNDTSFTQIEIFKHVLEAMLGLTGKYQQHNSQESHSGSESGSEMNSIVDRFMISIFVPTTILSIFLLITMTIFLCIHMVLQIALYMTNYMSNDRPLENSSTLVLMGFLSIITLETILPWLCLFFGVYITFAVGGYVFILSIIFMYLSWMIISYLRERMYADFQDGTNVGFEHDS
mmetsp:Transcript_1022/g.1118  ORF Transcript_1022/g.1118 Transcript_1022/m.1118 type:complete len:347 (-) Transcript_1022:462-1502(-)